MQSICTSRCACYRTDQKCGPASGPSSAGFVARAGRASLIRVRISGVGNQSLIDEQRRDRDTEYREVVDRVPQFLAEIEMETARGRATYMSCAR